LRRTARSSTRRRPGAETVVTDRPSTDAATAGHPAAETDEDESAEVRKPRARSLWDEIKEYGGLILIALVLAIIIKTFLIQAFYIPSSSMVPTLLKDDRVLVCRICTRFGDVHRGDIVVFSDPGSNGSPDRGMIGGALHWLGEAIGVARPQDDDFIKRVAAVGGDTWEIRAGTLYVNGERVQEPYLNTAEPDTRSFGPETVPSGMLFVLGDNRLQSGDSRFPRPNGTGLVPEEKVIGKAFVIVWPPSRIGGVG
jgi:signal peptidase I